MEFPQSFECTCGLKFPRKSFFQVHLVVGHQGFTLCQDRFEVSQEVFKLALESRCEIMKMLCDTEAQLWIQDVYLAADQL